MLDMLVGLLTWTAHSKHQEVWAGASWSSYALQVHSLLSHGFCLNPLFDNTIRYSLGLKPTPVHASKPTVHSWGSTSENMAY
jgi:hypothetical protein